MNAFIRTLIEEQSAPHSLSRRANCVRQPQRVALVDDDEVFGVSFSEGLRQLGFEAVHFLTAADGIGCLRQQEFDVMVVDWQIGPETSEALIREWAKEEREATSLRLIVMSGHIEPSGHCLDGNLQVLIDRYGLEWRAKPYSIRALARELRGMCRDNATK